MGSTINFVTLNVRSVANQVKRNSIFQWLNEKHKGIYFLQETHSIPQSIDMWQKESNSKFFCSHGSTNSKGVAIVIPNSYSFEQHSIKTDGNGRIVILHATILGEELVLANVYFPTKDFQKDQCNTLTNLLEMLSDYVGKSLIIGGDFNIALDLDLDKHGGRRDTNESKQFRLELNAFLDSQLLIDQLRCKNPDKHLFTWYSKHLKVSSRLDYFFISEHLSNRIIKCNISPSILTDHRLVQITLQLNKDQTRGAGYWKFNTNLLHDKEYIKLVTNIIEKIKLDMHACHNKGLVWDVMKMHIRGETIKYCTYKNKKQKELENRLTQEITELSIKHSNKPDHALLEKIDSIKCENISKNYYHSKS